MKMKAIVPILAVFLMASSSAWAQAQMFSISVPTPIPDPLAGFNVSYTLGGSKYGVGAASAQLKFYLSTSSNGSTGLWPIFSTQILLNGSGLGPYYPPAGTQTQYISRFSMHPDTVAMLESRCQAQTWYVLGQLDSTAYRSGATLLGTNKPADFYFTGGTISPSVIQPGGSTSITFDLYTRCPASTQSTVGMYLANSSYQLISYIGGVNVGTTAGTHTLPPSTITFSSALAPGRYYIVLFADDYGVVAESNENNNVGSFTLDIVAPSALAASGDGTAGLEPDVAPPANAASRQHAGEADAYLEQR